MKQKNRSAQKRKVPKTHLRLPDLEFSKTAVLNSLTSTDGCSWQGPEKDCYCSCARTAGIYLGDWNQSRDYRQEARCSLT
jgi:hypothetical protein